MCEIQKATVALLPGSYDPVTKGHMDVICRAATMFDRVIVAVMNNDSKDYCYDMEARTEMVRLACAHLPRVQVVSSEGRLVDLFDQVGADVIVKGVRNEADYLYEQKQAAWNRTQNSRAETLYLPADPACGDVSSTLVRRRLAAGQGIDDLVPTCVAAYIKERTV